MSESPEGRSSQARTSAASVWAFLGSARFAIYLLLILAAAAVLGTVIRQGALAPPGGSLRAQVWYVLARLLQLHDVYHSWWFIALLWLISINLAISSWRRGRRVWRQTRHPAVVVECERVAAMRDSREWEVPAPAQDAESRVVAALRRLGYAVKTARSGDAVAVHAQRGTLGAWGSFVSHVSMLIIFAGAAFGRLPGMGFGVVASIAVGSAYQIPDTDISVALKRMDVVLDQQQRISQYESDLEIKRGGRRVAAKTISVNHPLSYAGYNMYQSTWGTQVNPGEVRAGEAGFDLVARPPGGETDRVPVSLPLLQPGLRGKVVELKQPAWRLFLQDFQPGAVVENGERQRIPALVSRALLLGAGDHGSSGGEMQFTDLDAIYEGEPTVHEGVELSLDNVRIRSGVEIRRDRGVPIVWVGCALLVVGLFLTFYIWPRTLRAHISPRGDGATVVAGAAGRGDNRGAADLHALEQAVRGADVRRKP